MIIYKKIEKNLVIPCGLGPSVCPETWYELQGKTVDSSIASQTVEPDSGYYGLYRVIVNPIHDGNLLPGNIKNGVEILGVMGTYAGELMRLQAKTVDASAASVTVTFDPSYDGLSSVTVNAAPLQSKTVDSSTVSQTLTPDSLNYGLGQVTVNPYTLDSKTVNSSTSQQVINSSADGLSSVTVEPYVLDSKTVDSSTVSQTVTSSADGLSSVTVNPYVLDSKTVDSSTVSQTVTSSADGLSSVTVNPYVLDSKTVDPSTSVQTVTSDEDGLSSVTVNAALLENRTVDPSTVQIDVQRSSLDYYGLGHVYINPVTSGIDPDIQAGNIKEGVEILGVIGTLQGGPLQAKTADSSTSSQTLTPDNLNYGLSSVTINPYTLETKSDTLTANGQYVYTADNADGLSAVTIDVSIRTALDLQSKTVDSSTSSQNVIADSEYDGLSSVTVNPYTLEAKTQNITQNGTYTVTPSNADGLSSVDISVNVADIPAVLQTKSVSYNQNGEYQVEPDQGYEGISHIDISVNVPDVPPELQSKTVDSSTSSQTVTADQNYDGLSSVTVNPYILDSKTVDPSTSAQTVTSDEDGLSSVTVNAAPLQNKTVDSSTVSQTLTPDGSNYGLGQVTVNPYTLDSKTVNSSTSQQVVNSSADGLSSVTVNPYTVEAKTDTLTANGQYVYTPSNADAISSVTIDVSINTVPDLQSKTVDSSTLSQTVTADQNYDGLSSVTVNPYVLDSKTVDCSTGQQVITSDADGLSSVTVNAAKLQGRTVMPQKTDNTIYPNASNGYIGFNKVTIYGVTAAIDSDIQPENIKQGVEILGVTGTYEGTVINNQNKTVSSSTSSQTVTADSSYTGLGTVTINPYTLDAKTVNPSTNSITVNSSADGMSSVTVNAVTASIDPDIQAGNIKKDVEILGVVGTYEGTVINNQNKTVNPSTNSQSVTADQGYTGLGTVTVNPYTVETDSSTITQNGTYTFTPQNANALSSVTVDVSVEGGSGDCEERPNLIGVYNSQTPAHAGVVFDSGFPITDENGMTNTEFEGYFSLGYQSKPSQYFVFGNRSSVDQGIGDRYYWGIWVSSANELVVSFGAEDEAESAVFTSDEVSSRDLPIVWSRMTNDNYGTEDDEYGTEYIYEIRIGDVTKYAPAFDDRLEFFENVNVCVFGCSGAQQGYEATAPTDTICRYMYAVSTAEVDGEEQQYELALDPYVLNGETTLYSTISQDGEPETEEPLTPVILDGHATIERSEFDVDTGNTIYVDASTEEQHIAMADGNMFTPYVMVNPYTVETNSSTLTANGTYTFTPQGADALSSVTVDVSVASGSVINNQNKTVNSSTSSQNITADQGYTGLGTVTVNPYTLDTKTVNPSTNSITVNSSADGMSSVTVNAVTAAIDPDISAGNIRRGVNILGVIGTYDGSTAEWTSTTINCAQSDLRVLEIRTDSNEIYFAVDNTLTITSFPLFAYDAIGHYPLFGSPNVIEISSNVQTLSLWSPTDAAIGINQYSVPNLERISFGHLTTVTAPITHWIYPWKEIILNVDWHALTYSSADYNITAALGGYLISLEITSDVYTTDSIYLSWASNLDFSGVYSVLASLGTNGTNKSVNFYTGGLSVVDNSGDELQSLYNTAIANGWTINNLTITPFEDAGQFECPDCGGSGEVDGDTCPTCGGSGYVDWDPDSGETYECPDCGGSGEVDGDTCPTCGGSGYVDWDPTA